MHSGLRTLKKTRNLNLISETLNLSVSHQRGGSIDTSMVIPHNSSQVSLRGSLKRNADIPFREANHFESFHTV